MKSFLQFLAEGLTIALDPDDKVEGVIYNALNAMEDKTYADSIIRWYRNTKQVDPERAKKFSVGDVQDGQPLTTGSELNNLIDSVKSFAQTIKKAKQFELDGTVEIKNTKGVVRQIDIYDGMNDKYMTFDQGRDFMEKVAVKVRDETVSDEDTQEALMIKKSDLNNIRILGSSEHFVCWMTQEYESTNKFVFQLWQNSKTLGLGEVYGSPKEQTPYCTHSKKHWDDAVQKCPANKYRQFWILKKIEGVDYTPGYLSSQSVNRAFRAMKGKGPEIIECMTDTNGECLNQVDEFYYMSTSTRFDNMKEIEQLARQLFDCVVTQHQELSPFYPMLFIKGEGHNQEPVKPFEEHDFQVTENSIQQGNIAACDLFHAVSYDTFTKSLVDPDGKTVNIKLPEKMNNVGYSDALSFIDSLAQLPRIKCAYLSVYRLSKVKDFTGMPDMTDTYHLRMLDCGIESFKGFMKIQDDASIEFSSQNFKSFDGAPVNIREMDINFADGVTDDQIAQYQYFLVLNRCKNPSKEVGDFIKRHTSDAGNYVEQPVEFQVDDLIAKFGSEFKATCIQIYEKRNGGDIPSMRGVDSGLKRKLLNKDKLWDEAQNLKKNADAYEKWLVQQESHLQYRNFVSKLAYNQAMYDLTHGISVEQRMAQSIPEDDKKRLVDFIDKITNIWSCKYNSNYCLLLRMLFRDSEYGGVRRPDGDAEEALMKEIEEKNENIVDKIIGYDIFGAVTLETYKGLENTVNGFEEIYDTRSIAFATDFLSEKMNSVINSEIFQKLNECLGRDYGEFVYNAQRHSKRDVRRYAGVRDDMPDDQAMHKVEEWAKDAFERFFKLCKEVQTVIDPVRRIVEEYSEFRQFSRNSAYVSKHQTETDIWWNVHSNIKDEWFKEIINPEDQYIVGDIMQYFVLDYKYEGETIEQKYNEELENIPSLVKQAFEEPRRRSYSSYSDEW